MGSKKTRHSGVRSLGDGKYEIRAKVIDPKTGRPKNLVRVVEAPNAVEAAAKRAALRSGWLTTRLPAQPASRLRLEDAGPRWVSDVRARLRASTLGTYADAMDRWIDALGSHYLDAIEPGETQAVLDRWRADGLSASTVNGRLRVLRTMARELGVSRMIEGVRAIRATVREEETEEDEGRGLDVEEWRRYLDAGPTAAPAWWPLLGTLAWTGLRFSEASALEWKDVDLDAATLRVRRRQVRGQLDHVKAKASKRTVIIPDELVGILRAHRARQVGGIGGAEGPALLFPAFRERRAGEASAYVSSSGAGRASVAVCRAAGIKLDGRPRLHCLRHSLNNALRQVASELVRQSLVGHADAEIGKRYSAVTMDEKRAATAAVVRLVRSGT